MHFGEQFHAIDGLDDIVAATAGVADLDAVGFGLGGDHDDRHGTGPLVSAQLAQRFKAAHPWHDDVHQNQIGIGFEGTGDAFNAIARDHQLIGLLSENHLFHLQDGFRVIDE